MRRRNHEHSCIFPPYRSPAARDSYFAKRASLLLVGEHETVYDAGKAVRRLKHVARQVIAEIIPCAGHDLTLAQADLVDRRIFEFVKQNAAAPKTSGTRAEWNEAVNIAASMNH